MENLDDAIRAKIAQEVINALTPKDKEKVLTSALKEALGSYKVRNCIDEAVEDMAKKEVTTYLENPEVRERIRKATVVAVEKFIGLIPQALIDVLLRSCMGYSQYGGRADTDFTKAMERLLGIKRQ